MTLFGKRRRTARSAGDSEGPGGGPLGFLSALLGGREIEKRVQENFPSWQEFSQEKLDAAQEQKAERRYELPPHRLYVSSPLQRNFMYFLLVAGALGIGYAVPDWAPSLVYAAIILVFLTALLVLFRDGLLFHLEGQRLKLDAEMINKHARGPAEGEDDERRGFLRSLARRKKTIFRSKLLQIHYQNVLRTFEQGNRRAWVDQDASLMDIQTLLSQRGMKLVWTFMEVLPQLGLLGTLIGLLTMFLAFNTNAEFPELAIIAGFGTALGTTILANLLVLILRPLYMQNERSMNEILSSMQMLMAMFILPTQQFVLDRGRVFGYGHPGVAMPPGGPSIQQENRLARTLDGLTGALQQFSEAQQQLDSGTMARETSKVAREVQNTLQQFQVAFQPEQLGRQQHAVVQLTEAVQSLAQHLKQVPAAEKESATSERIGHDLMQLRLLTHDTLLLLEQIAGHLQRFSPPAGELLSANERVRAQTFGAEPPRGDRPLDAADEPGAPEPARREPSTSAGQARIRLFEERR